MTARGAGRVRSISRDLLGAGLILVSLALLAGCTLQEPPPAVAVDQATLPAPTTPTATVTATPRPPTATATPVPTHTPVPSLTPAPTGTPAPTETTDPGLAGFGYCRTDFGPEQEARFSAQLASIEAQQTDLTEQVTFTFSETSGLLHGLAAC